MRTLVLNAGYEPLAVVSFKRALVLVLEGKAAVTHLLAALMKLPERTRDVFVLRMFEDLRPGDIADGMGISRRAVEKHFACALKHACEALADWRP